MTTAGHLGDGQHETVRLSGTLTHLCEFAALTLEAARTEVILLRDERPEIVAGHGEPLGDRDRLDFIADGSLPSTNQMIFGVIADDGGPGVATDANTPRAKHYAAVGFHVPDSEIRGLVRTINVEPRMGDDRKQRALRMFAEMVVRQFTDQALIEEQVTRSDACSRALEKAIASADADLRAKSAFYLSLSHDLRTPLNAIIGYSELLADELGERGEQELGADLMTINTSGRQLLTMVNDILDVVAIDADNKDVIPYKFDFHELVYDLVATLEPLSEASKTRIAVDMEGTPKLMVSDAMLVRQLLTKLISNVINRTAEGLVVLRARGDSAKQEITVEISDTRRRDGEGRFGDETPDEKADPEVTEDSSGGTIPDAGLALARKLCALLGGRFEASVAQAQGVRFKLTMPLDVEASLESGKMTSAERRRRASRLLTAPAQDGARPLVLIVDGDDVARDILKRHVVDTGCDVIEAAFGRDAIELAEKWRPDIIMLDVMLPDNDGWSILAELKCSARCRDIPVIIASVLDERLHGFTLGASEFLLKPVERRELRRLLARYQCEHPPCRALIFDPEGLTSKLLAREFADLGWAATAISQMTTLFARAAEIDPEIVVLDAAGEAAEAFDVLHRLRDLPGFRELPAIVIVNEAVGELDRSSPPADLTRVLHRTQYTDDIAKQMVRFLAAVLKRERRSGIQRRRKSRRRDPDGRRTGHDRRHDGRALS